MILKSKTFLFTKKCSKIYNMFILKVNLEFDPSAVSQSIVMGS